MEKSDREGVPHAIDTNSVIRWLIIAIEYAIVLSLMLVAAIVLVRSLVNFLDDWNEFPQSVVSAIDGILVVIILLDIAHTVFGTSGRQSFRFDRSSSLEFWPVFETS